MSSYLIGFIGPAVFLIPAIAWFVFGKEITANPHPGAAVGRKRREAGAKPLIKKKQPS